MTNRLPAVFVATALLLSGCLIPEKFTATAEFQPDGSYAFAYSGTAVHAMAAMQIAKAGSLSAKENAGLEKEAGKMAKDPMVLEATYKGAGRYKLMLATKRKRGEALDVMKVLTVKTDNDGVTTISSIALDARGKQQLAQLNMQLDGKLEVKLPKNAEVMSHNATGTPSFFGGAYSWKVNGMDQRPLMKIRIK